VVVPFAERFRDRGFFPTLALAICVLGTAVVESACGYVGAEFSPESSIQGAGGHGSDSGGAGGFDGVGGTPTLGGASNDGVGGESSPGSGGDAPLGAGGDNQLGVGGAQEGVGGEAAASTGGGDGAGGEPSVDICSAGCDEDDGNFFISHTIGIQNPEKIILTGMGSYEFDGDVAQRSGGSSLKLISESAGDEAEVNNTILVLSQGQLHLRAWLLVPEGSMSDWVKVVGLNGSETDGPHVRIDSEGRLVVYIPGSEELWRSETDSFPRGEWFCLQILVEVDDLAGSIEIRVDGATVLLTEDTDTRPDAGIRVVVYGMAEIGPGSSKNVLYFDRVRGGYGEPLCDETSSENVGGTGGGVGLPRGT
jgi:hypothetical protein